MALQYSVTLRNNQLDQIESTTGTDAKLRIYTGTNPPSDCAAADNGTLIVEIPLPTDWMSAAATGSKAKLGTWSAQATGAGTLTAGHFRIKNSAGTTTHLQGTITATGGGGDMTIDNTSISNGQTVTVSTFQINAGNA
jgi:hypothetical protein